MGKLLKFLVTRLSAHNELKNYPDFCPSQSRPSSKTDSLVLTGRTGVVRQTLGQGQTGMVLIQGELWRAELLAQDGLNLPPEIEPGAKIKVIRQQGLKLWVVPIPKIGDRGWGIEDRE